MSVLFQRRCTLVVDSVQIKDLRLQFKVEKTSKREPNTCDVSVWNLKDATRAALKSKGARIILLAGYEDSEAQIFAGDARTVDHIRQGADTVTKIQCGDGERAYRNARVSESFVPGSKVLDVIKKAAGVLQSHGIDPGGFSAVAGMTDQFVGGHAMHGSAMEELDLLLRPRGFEVSIQDGRMQILRIGEAAPNTAILLTPDSGLIGSPEHGTPDKKGGPSVLKFKSLLQPGIRPGVRITIRSRDTNGTFRVQKLVHAGDTAGGEFYTTGEAL